MSRTRSSTPERRTGNRLRDGLFARVALFVSVFFLALAAILPDPPAISDQTNTPSIQALLGETSHGDDPGALPFDIALAAPALPMPRDDGRTAFQAPDSVLPRATHARPFAARGPPRG